MLIIYPDSTAGSIGKINMGEVGIHLHIPNHSVEVSSDDAVIAEPDGK